MTIPVSRFAAWLAAFVVCVAPASSAAPAPRARDADESLARYLESRDLRPLLMDHLQQAMERTPIDERLPIAERLAALYAEELERSPDAEARAALEQRARALLDAVPDSESFDLRLNLHRLAYNRAEAVAERARLRLVSPIEVEEAIRSLRALTADLGAMGVAANKRVEALEKSEENARDLDLDFVRESLTNARRRRSLAMYLAGWAGVYLAELASQPQAAADAARRFGWILNASAGEAPAIQRVPDQSLKFDHVARAAIGVGVCASIRGDFLEATRWFDAVEHAPDAPAPVRDQLFARRAAAAARAGEWPDVLRLCREARGSEDPVAPRDSRASGSRALRPLTPADARLLAVLSYEAVPQPRFEAVLRKLRDIALADLVASDELAQVLDLASRYGAEPLGTEGFIPLYVRALQAHQRARESHRAAAAAAGANADEPPRDRETISLYESTRPLLLAAMQSDDADRFPQARADAAMLVATAVYYAAGSDQARALDAADRFFAAGKLALTPAAASDAAWMMIRALDLAAGDAPATKHPGDKPDKSRVDALARRDAAVAEFLRRYPDDQRCGALLLRQSASGRLAPDQAAESLLRVPADSPSGPAARREAARLLYARWREAPEGQKPQAAARFVGVAEAIFREEASAASPDKSGPTDHASRAVVIGRQLLDATLTPPSIDAARAAAVLEALTAIGASGAADLAPHRAELLYRRAQLAAARNDDLAADAAADELHASASADADQRFRSAVSRFLYRRAVLAWRSSQDEALARRIIRHGARVLVEVVPQGSRPPTQPESPDAVVALHAAIGQAAAWLDANTTDPDARALADRMFRAALELQPSNETVLRRLAEHAERGGDTPVAIDCWRRLASGAEAGSPSWFEARYRLCAVLAKADPAAARELLSQHRALYPTYGPSPWGEQLRALADRLGSGGAP